MSEFRNIITHPDAERAKFTELHTAAYVDHISTAIDRHYDALCDVIDDIIREAGNAVIEEQRGNAA